MLGHTAALSHPGRRRRHNEDAYVVQPPLFAVADGMGGAKAGEVASGLAAAAVQESGDDGESGEARVAGLIEEANRRVFRRASEDREASGMGTTMTVALVGPWITKERVGKKLRQRNAVRRIVAALRTHQRTVRIRADRVSPSLTRARFGPIVVIRRDSKRLHFYRGMRLWKVFGVATGQSSYPTPIGWFRIVTMQRNPWWYPPDAEWAEGQEPVPPGPGNPLGTRWMGLSVSAVGMHGTPDAASIGYSASHGCIRMRIAEAEWLFNRVRLGTTVFIVRA